MSETEVPEACTSALERHLQPDVFRALCDPQRLALLARLATASAPMTVTEASSCCGVHISGVSRHLALLKSVGVVEAEKHGREMRYRVSFDHLIGTLRGLADALEDCCNQNSCC